MCQKTIIAIIYKADLLDFLKKTITSLIGLWGLCGLLAAQTFSFLNAPDTVHCSREATLLPREVRAVWLTTIGGLDWPGHPTQYAAGWQRQREDLCRQLDQLKELGINTVILQTRIRGTVIYPSAIEPFDDCITGLPDHRPDYDPLAFCIEECHRRGMECHAWVVCFPVGKFAQQKRYGARAVNVRHPELVQRTKEQWIMDPAKAGTATYLADLCGEIVSNYDVDGIQLDYVRYPEKEVGFKTSLPLAERQANVTRVVRAIHDRIKAIRPWVKLSCSPVGKYADLPRQTSRGWNARDAVAQDAVLWLREGLMDWLAPMMYFQGQNFYPFVCDWQERSYGRPIVPGLGIYFLSPQEKNWPLSAITAELGFLRSQGAGHAFFRTRFLLDNVKGLRNFVDLHNQQTALWPAMTWTDDIAPEAPRYECRREGFNLHITWNSVTDNEPGVPVCYNVYRIPRQKGAAPVLLAQNLKTTAYTYTPALPALLHDTFVVTALDAYGNESLPSYAR